MCICLYCIAQHTGGENLSNYHTTGNITGACVCLVLIL